MDYGHVTYYVQNKDNITDHKMEMKSRDVINAVSVAMVMDNCTGPFSPSEGSCINGKLKNQYL